MVIMVPGGSALGVPPAGITAMMQFALLAALVNVMNLTPGLPKVIGPQAASRFLIKFTLVITGLVVTWFYFNTMRRESPEWEAKGAISQRGYRFVAATMVWWAGVLVAGRLTAYLGQLYAQ